MYNANLIRLVIADDHPVVRAGLTTILKRASNMLVLGQASDWPDAIRKVSLHRPDIALLDLHMPGMDAPQALAVIRRQCPDTRIVMLSAFDHEEEVHRVLQAGATGFLLKDCTQAKLRECLRTVYNGKTFIEPSLVVRLIARERSRQLTYHQTEILQLVTDGKTNKEVGAAMSITEGTVKVQVNRIFRKLGVEGRTAAVTKALRSGIVRMPKSA